MWEAAAATDADLMRRAAAGDRDAFAELYRRYHPSVYRFGRLMTGSDTLAEDVVQDVFLSLMCHPSRYDAGRASLTSYLYGAARHYTRRRLVRERRFVTLDAAPEAEGATLASGDAASVLVSRCELQRLRRAIVSLPSRYREVIVLCDLEDLSYADAAVTVGCAIGTVRSRLHRARQLLAEKMRRAEAQPEKLSRSLERCAV
jgi:RNA polymerase sigma-70 factor (ECF subfamily)